MDIYNKEFITTSPGFNKTTVSLKEQIKSTRAQLSKTNWLQTSIDSANSAHSDMIATKQSIESPQSSSKERLRTTPLRTRFESENPLTQQTFRTTYNRNFSNNDPVNQIKMDRVMYATLN